LALFDCEQKAELSFFTIAPAATFDKQCDPH
jgi:hypothetical protein